MIDDGTNISIEQSLLAGTPAKEESPSVLKAKDRFIQKAHERMNKEKQSSSRRSTLSKPQDTKPIAFDGTGQPPHVFELTKEILKHTTDLKKKTKQQQQQPRTPVNNKRPNIIEEYKAREAAAIAAVEVMPVV